MTAGREGDRDQQPEMRLIAEGAKQEPRDDRSALDKQGRAGEQRRGQKGVLPPTEIPQQRRKGEQRQDGPTPFPQNGGGDKEVKGKRPRLEDKEGREIGQMRQRGT